MPTRDVTKAGEIRLGRAGNHVEGKAASQDENIHSQSKKSLSRIKWQAFANTESENSPCEVAQLSVCSTPTQSSLAGDQQTSAVLACDSPASFPGSQRTQPFCF